MRGSCRSGEGRYEGCDEEEMKDWGGRNVRRGKAFVGGAAAAAGFLAIAMTVAAQAPQKTAKDQGETDIYGAVMQDIGAKNFAKAITDLDTWSQKYPDTQFKEMQQFFYETAYNGMNPPNDAKALEVANNLLDKNPADAFPGSPQTALNVYYLALTSAGRIQNPTPDQLAIGDKAAHKLVDYSASYFTDANKPAQVSAADWNNAHETLKKAADQYLYYETVSPAEQARVKKDWPAAEAGYLKALQTYPDKTYLVYWLAVSINNQKDIKRAPQAAWLFARAATMDATLGGTQQNTKPITDYAKKYYTNLHGNADGYDEFAEKSKGSLMPPDGFTIVNVDQQHADAVNKWNDDHKEAASWGVMKAGLTAPDGAQFFEQMKDATFPPMKGTLVDATPACRSKSLTVSIPSFDSDKNPAEITLKLTAPLKGKPTTGGEVTFSEGVTKSYTASPLMVTVEIEPDKIQGMKVDPCAAAAPVRKGVTKKK